MLEGPYSKVNYSADSFNLDCLGKCLSDLHGVFSIGFGAEHFFALSDLFLNFPFVLKAML